jgi:hypothetical protein
MKIRRRSGVAQLSKPLQRAGEETWPEENWQRKTQLGVAYLDWRFVLALKNMRRRKQNC